MQVTSFIDSDWLVEIEDIDVCETTSSQDTGNPYLAIEAVVVTGEQSNTAEQPALAKSKKSADGMFVRNVLAKPGYVSSVD